MRNHVGSKTSFLLKYSVLSIILVYNLGTILGIAIFYPLIPVLMGYPKEVMEINGKVGISYDLQYIIIALFSIVVGTLFLMFLLRGIGKWQNAINDGDSAQLDRIREKCINIPYKIFIIQVALLGIPVFIMLVIVSFIGHGPFSLLLKIFAVVFSYSSLAAVFSHIFCKRLFRKILLKTYNGQGLQGRRIVIKNKIFLQILPMFVVALLLLSLLSYSRLIKEKGDLGYEICRLKLHEVLSNSSNFQSKSELFEAFNNIEIKNPKVGYFAVNLATGDITTSDGYVPGAFFSYFTLNPVQGERVYSDTYEIQGIEASIKINGQDYYAGIRFENGSDKNISITLIALFVIILLNIFILYYFSKYLTDEISLVAEFLNEIAEGEYADLDKRLSVISNDELGDLVIAFNKIRDRQFEYDKLKADFMANISHELRTPINVIYITVQLLESYIKKGLTQKFESSGGNLKVIKQNCLRLIRLINNIIDTTKIDAGYLKLQVRPVDIVSYIKQIAESVAEYCESRDIAFHFDTNLEEKIIICDVEKIETIVLNLLSNAMKFTKPGGDIYIKICDNTDKVIISIKDTGIGIPITKQEVIFDRFRQVEQSLARDYEGSGIGLSLVKSLVEMHDGTVRVESEEGKGSEFIIELPVKETVADGYGVDWPELTRKATVNNTDRIIIEFADICSKWR